MRIKIELQDIPEEALDSVRYELEDMGWTVYGYKRLRAVKEASKINLNREMYGLNVFPGIRDIEFINL